MLTLAAKIRKEIGKKVQSLRQKDLLPAVLYGPKVKNLNLELGLKEFEKVYQEAGESSLISLQVEGQKPSVRQPEKFLVLIHEVQLDSLSGKPIHIDFYQPKLEEEIEINVPLILEGEAPAVRELGGTLIKNISEVKVKALPQKLPHEIKIDIQGLKTLEDNILIKDLKVPEGVKILKEPEEIIVSVSPPEKVEEELVKPIEEKIEEVEVVEKEGEVEIEAKEKEERKEISQEKKEHV